MPVDDDDQDEDLDSEEEEEEEEDDDDDDDDEDDDDSEEDELESKSADLGIWDMFELDPGVIKSREEFAHVSQESWEDDDGTWEAEDYEKSAQEFFGDKQHFGQSAIDQFLIEGCANHPDNEALLEEAESLPGVSTKTFDFFDKDGTVVARGFQTQEGLESLKAHWPDFDFSELNVVLPDDNHTPVPVGKIPDKFKEVDPADTVDLRTYCTPVGDQGQTSRCSAFAWTHAFETAANIVKQPIPRLSPNHTMMQIQQYMGDFKDYKFAYTGGNGSSRSPELGSTLLGKGICRNDLWADDQSEPKGSDDDMASDAAIRRLKQADVVPIDIDHVKHLVSSGCPVHLIMNTGPNFSKTGRDGIIQAAEEPEGKHGCHAMLIVGYFGNHFIVKNSWGADWGDEGYCYIPKKVLTQANSTFAALVPKT